MLPSIITTNLDCHVAGQWLGILRVGLRARHRYRKGMRWLGLILWLSVLASPVEAADITPVPGSPPSSTPQDLLPEKSVPDAPPSTRDPGMVKQPETAPHPDSVVTPPVIDPKMAIDPEARTEEERHPTRPPEQTLPPVPPKK